MGAERIAGEYIQILPGEGTSWGKGACWVELNVGLIDGMPDLTMQKSIYQQPIKNDYNRAHTK